MPAACSCLIGAVGVCLSEFSGPSYERLMTVSIVGSKATGGYAYSLFLFDWGCRRRSSKIFEPFIDVDWFTLDSGLGII